MPRVWDGRERFKYHGGGGIIYSPMEDSACILQMQSINEVEEEEIRPKLTC